jgi:antitoxin component of RelBE/YafQ-DinJ toxin-antitoxin module
MGVRIPAELAEKTDMLAARLGQTRSDVMRLALEQLLNEIERTGALTIKVDLSPPAPPALNDATAPAARRRKAK